MNCRNGSPLRMTALVEGVQRLTTIITLAMTNERKYESLKNVLAFAIVSQYVASGGRNPRHVVYSEAVL